MIVLLTALSVLSVTVIYSVILGIGPTLTSAKVRKTLLQQLPDSIPGPIYELGSGWGTLLADLARAYPQAHLVGYELNPLPFFISYFRLINRKKLRLLCRNFFKHSLAEAALVVCYLYPQAMSKLEKKFQRELPSGAIVISHTFALRERKPDHVAYANDLYRTPIYLYRY